VGDISPVKFIRRRFI